MTEDDDALLKALGARARAREAEPVPEGIPAFDAAAEERMAARLLSKVEAKSHAKPGGAVVRPLRWAYAAMPLAAAAAVLLFFLSRRSPHGDVPTYEMSVVAASELRAPAAAKASDAEVVLDPEGELELVARPSVPVKQASARAFLTRAGETTPWPVPIDVSDEGAVKISGSARTLFPATSGAYVITLVVGAGESMPSPADARKLATAGASEDTESHRVIRARVRFEEKK